MTTLLEQSGLTREQILHRANIHSPKDIVYLTGSRVAGLDHYHSDYDFVVITSGPIPDSRACGTKFFYGVEPHVVPIDINYWSFDRALEWLAILDPSNESRIIRVPFLDLWQTWRLVMGQAIFNEEDLLDLQNRFGVQRLIEVILKWNSAHALADLLEAYDAAYRGNHTAAHACANRAISFAAEAAAARHGDAYPSPKFVHEKCRRVSRFEPNLLESLWELESRPTSSSETVLGFLEDCTNFCNLYLRRQDKAPPRDMILRVPITSEEAILIRPADQNYIVWNKAEMVQVSPDVASLWDLLSSEEHNISTLSTALAAEQGLDPDAVLGKCRRIVETLERLGLVKLDWLSMADA